MTVYVVSFGASLRAEVPVEVESPQLAVKLALEEIAAARPGVSWRAMSVDWEGPDGEEKSAEVFGGCEACGALLWEGDDAPPFTVESDEGDTLYFCEACSGPEGEHVTRESVFFVLLLVSHDIPAAPPGRTTPTRPPTAFPPRRRLRGGARRP